MKRARLVFLVLLAALALAGAGRLRFDAEVLNLLPQSSPAVRGLALYQDHIANARELILTLEARDATRAESAARQIAARLRGETNLVRRVIWMPPWEESGEVAAELPACFWLNQPPDLFSNLLARLEPEPLTASLVETREQLAASFSPEELARGSYDPLGWTRIPGDAEPPGVGASLFASEDGRFRVMFIEASPPLPGYRECDAWLTAVRERVDRWSAAQEWGDEVTLAYTGRPAFLSEIAMGMERDMTGSVAGTFVVVALLFYAAHRRLKPMAWLAMFLALILSGTMALGGLLFGEVNVVSMGFAAILLGLSADYGLVLYQEAKEHPEWSPGQVRREVGPGIAWSALTTSLAFALLHRSSLPGLSQLGTLVAVGVLVAAFLMLSFYLRPGWSGQSGAAAASTPRPLRSDSRRAASVAWMVTFLILTAGLGVMIGSPPPLDRTANALRPDASPAYRAVERMQVRLGRTDTPLWLVMPRPEEATLDLAETALASLQARGLVSGYTLPGPLWPRPSWQAENRRTAGRIVDRWPEVERAVLEQGFNTNALTLARGMVACWREAAGTNGLHWPRHPHSRWILEQMIHPDPPLAVGIVRIDETGADQGSIMKELRRALGPPQFLLTGWPMLGPDLLGTVQRELGRLWLPMLAVIVACLVLAFRTVRPVVLSLLTMAVSGAALCLVMRVAGWSWNLMNLMALPLMLGAGLDYSIHMQLALRRHPGDTARVRRTIGKAVGLCAATSAAGFGSLAFSSNAGLAGLGRICATGLVLTSLVAVFLLPAWSRVQRRP